MTKQCMTVSVAHKSLIGKDRGGKREKNWAISDLRKKLFHPLRRLDSDGGGGTHI